MTLNEQLERAGCPPVVIGQRFESNGMLLERVGLSEFRIVEVRRGEDD